MEKTAIEGSPVLTSPPTRKYYIERSLGESSIEHTNQKLTKEEKAAHYGRSMDLLLNWPNWDVWPFKVSGPVIAMVAAYPGYILNTAFRSALLLGHYGRASSYLATMGLPAVISGLTHNLGITRDILEQQTRCPVCLQVRSASLLLACGFVYPLIFAPLTSFPIAAGMKNLYFPKIHKQPKEVLNFAKDVFRTVQNRYFAVGAAQVIVAMGITYLEQDCYQNTLLPILLGEKTITRKKVGDFYDE